MLDPGHEVVLAQQQLVVEIGDGEVGEDAHTLQHELLLLLLHDGRRDVADVVLYTTLKI